MSKKQATALKDKFADFLMQSDSQIPHEEWNATSKHWRVLFAHKKLVMTGVFLADDPGYVSFIVSDFYSLDTAEEKQAALLSAGETNRQVKIAKVYVNPDNNNVSASCEFYVADGKVDFAKYLELLRFAGVFFTSLMRAK